MTSEKDKMLSGELYSANDKVLVEERIKTKKLLENLRENKNELFPNATPLFI